MVSTWFYATDSIYFPSYETQYIFDTDWSKNIFLVIPRKYLMVFLRLDQYQKNIFLLSTYTYIWS